MTLKICIQLKQQRLNIFEDKVEKYGKKGEKAMKVFCEAGKVYVEQMLKQIKKSNVNRVGNAVRAEVEVREIAEQLKQMYEYVIEYFISIQCQQYLFTTIYMKIIKNLPSYQYWQLFIQSLTPFIIHSKLTSIPNAIIFREILTFFSSQKLFSTPQQYDNYKLIDKMITNLNKSSLYYEDSISILQQNKLFRSLGYICSMNGDFISVLNKLLIKMIEMNKGNMYNAQQEYYRMLQEYLGKIVGGRYVNERKIQKKVYENVVLKEIGLWMSYQDTVGYFLKQYKRINQKDKLINQKYQNNPFNNNKFTLLLTVVYQIIQQTSKLSSKQTIHQFLSHLFESLQNIQKKLLLKQYNQQKSSRLLAVHKFRYQIALMLLKFSNNFQLNSMELLFYVNYVYEMEENQEKQKKSIQNNNNNKQNNYNKQNNKQNDNNFVNITLQQQLKFILSYFYQLHCTQLIQKYSQTLQQKYIVQKIYNKKNYWIKYLYNFIVKNIIMDNQKEKQKDGQNQSKNVICSQEIVSIKDVKTDVKVIEKDYMNSQTNILLQKLDKQIELLPKSTKKAQSIKKLPTYHFIPNLSSLPFEPPTLPSPSSQSILCSFILSTCPFHYIDNFLPQLLHLSSQNTIIYLLQNYSLSLVNEKIQQLSNEETKYFVVRKVLKILRRNKRELKEKRNKQDRKVWGNKYKTLRQKEQARKQKQMNKNNINVLNNVQAQLSKPIMLFYITCLIKYKRQKRVYSQLSLYTQQYSLYFKQILPILTSYKLQSCLAFIHLYLKNYSVSLQHYQHIYSQIFDYNLQRLSQVKYCHGRFLYRVYENMLKICRIIDGDKDGKYERVLECVMEPLLQDNKFMRKKKQKVIELVQKVYDTQRNHAFIEQLARIIQQILLQISTHLPIHHLSTILSKYSQLMNKTFILNCLKSTLNTYSKSIFIYQISNKLVIKDQVIQFNNNYYQNKLKGIGYQNYCDQCKMNIQYDDKIEVYKCGHMYHKRMGMGVCGKFRVGEYQQQEEGCKICKIDQVGEKKGMEIKEMQSGQKDNQQDNGIKLAFGYLQSIKQNKLFSLAKDSQQQQQNKNNNNQLSQMNQNDQNDQKINMMYRCLAFEQFLLRQSDKFDQFRKDYDGYMARYD